MSDRGRILTDAGVWVEVDDLGGSMPANWVRIELAPPPTLNAGAPSHFWSAAEMSIDSQSGTDFSIGVGPGGAGRIESAQGGWFQSGIVFGTPAGVTLDAGSTHQRWLGLAFSMGDGSIHSYGLDGFVPVIEGAFSSLSDLATTFVSHPGYAQAGGAAFRGIQVELIANTGTDEVTLAMDNSYDLVIWQTGPV